MATTRKRRRIRSPHPGVVLIPPESSGRHPYWRARFVDPETNRTKKVKLDPLELRTAEARRDWAVRRAKSLARLRMDRAAGDAPASIRKPLREAIDSYFKTARESLRPSTVALYEAAAELFMEWAAKEGISSTTELSPSKLPRFRDYLLARRKRTMVAGQRRGKRVVSQEKLSPLTLNWQQRAVKALLNHLRIRGVVALSSDSIVDALKPLPVLQERADFLQPAECALLIDAALRHDAATFAATRMEHAGAGEPGTTLRYEPVAPFVAFTLLTGCRVGEALALKWSDVDLHAADANGDAVGEICLRASATKTKYARVVDLGVSPSLRQMLVEMKRRAGTEPYVFGGREPLRRTLAESARKRLVAAFGAPSRLGWQLLRATCATMQCNAPSIFGAAAAFMSAKRLGHSVAVSERHYAGLIRGISRDARTLEAAMQIERGMAELVRRVGRVGTGDARDGLAVEEGRHAVA